MVGAIKLRRPALVPVAGVALSLWASYVCADTLEGALVQASQNNPTLNSQRASVRATDENVPQALSGYRPKVSVNGSIGQQYFDTTTRSSTLNA
ncbi:MAG: TolC family protein, partial [Pseudolabrys sp.]